MMRPEEVRRVVQDKIAQERAKRGPNADVLLPVSRYWLPVRALEALFCELKLRDRASLRHSLMSYLVGKTTTQALTQAEADVLVWWAQSPAAQQEARMILDKCGVNVGQLLLL